MAGRNEYVIVHLLRVFLLGLLLDSLMLLELVKNKRRRLDVARNYSITDKIPSQVEHLEALISDSNADTLHQLRLGRNVFGKLCSLLRQFGGLTDTRGVSMSEQVAIFLSVISHHKKNCVVYFDFKRSGRTVSIHFHRVLEAVMRMHPVFIAKPEPVAADCTDERWKWFKGCLGALDGTYIEVMVPDADKPRFRSRKGKCSVNVLGVCDRNMNFTYVLTGWEGSAADGRVLRDAVHRPNGFRVPRGQYYLCDAGYTNGQGFLAPYRGVRYHLKEWGTGTGRPQNAKELFNLRHSKARNCIERAFGILKQRWAILRSQSYYDIVTHNKIIMACCLLHNFIRRELEIDPVEVELQNQDIEDEYVPVNYINHVETSPQWTTWRDDLAREMYNNYRR